MSEEPPRAKIMNGLDTKVAICRALNIDPYSVSKLTIVLDNGDVPRVYIEQFCFIEEGRSLAAVLASGDSEVTNCGISHISEI